MFATLIFIHYSSKQVNQMETNSKMNYNNDLFSQLIEAVMLIIYFGTTENENLLNWNILNHANKFTMMTFL